MYRGCDSVSLLPYRDMSVTMHCVVLVADSGPMLCGPTSLSLLVSDSVVIYVGLLAFYKGNLLCGQFCACQTLMVTPPCVDQSHWMTNEQLYWPNSYKVSL